MPFTGIALESSALRSFSALPTAQPTVGSPNPVREAQKRVEGNVGAVLFDFDGTLTATPGDKAERKFKIAELKERAKLLEPWMRRIRDAQITIGIISKSSEKSILDSLDQAKLRSLVNGPVVAKAVGFEGKVGFIQEMCAPEGPLKFLGPRGLQRVLLVDDDCHELQRAAERGVQTYPAPAEGGLLDDDFYEIFLCLGLETPPRPKDSKAVHCIWSWGKTGKALGLAKDPTSFTYSKDAAPLIGEFYEIEGDRADASPSGISAGAFGVVRPSVHVSSGLRCAVKVIRRERLNRHYIETFVENDGYTFLLKMAEREPHPNVLRQLDYLLGPTFIFNGMELLAGVDLFTFLSEAALITFGDARRFMKHIFSALQHIHQVSGIGLIHRDVKPENLRFRSPDPKSDLVLVDFGLSCPATPDTKRGIMGTAVYMAPEIYTQRYTTKVDLWSAGVILYVVLTGRLPWKIEPDAGYQPNRSLLKTGRVEALNAGELQAVPPPAVEVLNGLLVVEPGQRLSAAAALEKAWLIDGLQRGQSRDALQWQDPAPGRGTMSSPTGVQHMEYSQTMMSLMLSPKARIGIDLSDVRESGEPLLTASSLASTDESPKKELAVPTIGEPMNCFTCLSGVWCRGVKVPEDP